MVTDTRASATEPSPAAQVASRRGRDTAGFALLEVVVALAILVLFGFSLVTLHLAHSKLVDAADRTAELAAIARTAYDETREVAFDDLLALDRATTTVDARGQPVSEDLADYRVTYGVRVVEPRVIAISVEVRALAGAGAADRVSVVSWRDRP